MDNSIRHTGLLVVMVMRGRNTAAAVSKLPYNREVDEQNKSFTSLLLTMN